MEVGWDVLIDDDALMRGRETIARQAAVNADLHDREASNARLHLMRTLLSLFLISLFLQPSAHAEVHSHFSPKSMAYVLQARSLGPDRASVVKRLAECGRDVVVLDAVFTTDEGPWTPEELQSIRAGKPRRRVVAYVSIGEAEDYRSYWKKEWDADGDGKPDAAAPKFLNIENPDWKGNYRVRYWHKEWQEIMLPAVDQVVKQGFDGIYLDIVDAFEFYEYDPVTKDWRDDMVNTETGNTYRRDMITWVAAIAKRARDRKADFLVIPQNAAQLLAHEDYRDLISAIGVEDLFVNDSKLRSEKDFRFVTNFLKQLQAVGKPVLVIDYPKSDKVNKGAFELSTRHGFTHLLTDRDLKTLGISAEP